MLAENRLFYFSLSLSLLIHCATIVYISIQGRHIFRKPPKKIEVTYQQIKSTQAAVQENVIPRDLKIQKPEALPQNLKVLSKDLNTFSPVEDDIKDISKLSGKVELHKKQVPKIETMDVERKISIPVLKSEKISNPKYLSYNEAIRQKIKQRAYSYVNHPEFQAGEVYLTFVLDSRGGLRQLKIIDDRTSGSEYLRDIGLKSIQESNPFPPFPKDLNYPELTFNIVISFELGK